MRVAFLMPGAGGSFYCENCMRDAGLVRALHALGHEPITVPLYLPLQLDEPTPAPPTPVFFGGINVYLQQKLALFRRTPRWLDRLFDAPRLLRWAASKAGMTNPRDLAETTLSMLRGEEGRQVKELSRLVAWLRDRERPDVVCLSNALLLGVARSIKRELAAPVVCCLQDEDIFLDGLPEGYREEAWATVRERARDADLFIAVSGYFAAVMRKRLDLPAERLRVVHNGIVPEGYEPAPAPPEPPTIGFLERACPEKGLDILADAFLRLRAREGFAAVRLRVAGGMSAADSPFVRSIRKRLARGGAADAVEFLPNLERPARQEFLRSLSVLSVPARHAEAFGMYVLEALASGVPVVLPSHGAFPELLEATGGGLLYEPNDPDPLTDALAELLADRQRAAQLAQRGRQAVLETFTVERMAEKTLEAFREALSNNAS